MSAHIGHRSNPVHVVAPGELDRAVLRTWQPTEAQAAAGNYKMAHAVLGTWDRRTGRVCNGLCVTIETPLDRVRSGVGPDGTPWSVRMPAHYGYVKRTEGADGDHVDVYVGPDAHRACELPVWVVDQCDADTGGYDEHKVMLGFPDAASARSAYLGAFSDGKGHRRIGAVTRMTFDEFAEWLDSDGTKKPLAMKSASVAVVASTYGASTCRCEGRRDGDATPGGSMTTQSTSKPDASGATASIISMLVAKGMSSLTPEERSQVLTDAATAVGVDLAKAQEIVTGETHERIRTVTDVWDGAPDDRAAVTRAYGPDSSVEGGKVNVGPPQAASGDGAERMERQYSNNAPQSGVQRATEMLGREVAGMRGAMKSIIDVVRGQNIIIEALKSSTAATPAAPSAADISAMVEKAVAKALSDSHRAVERIVAKAIAKAKESDDEGDDEIAKAESEKEDEEAEEMESAKAETEIEIENEVEDEDEDDKESAKSDVARRAASLRLMAKSRVTWANKRVAKALSAVEDGKDGIAASSLAKARFNLSKAVAYVEASKALCDGKAGASTASILKGIAKAKRKIAENQDKWPASKSAAQPTASDASAAGATQPAADVTAKALEAMGDKISKALSGFGMIESDLKTMFSQISGQSRSGGANPIPMVKAVAGEDDLVTKERTVMGMADSGAIDDDDTDKAREVIGLMRAKAPPELVKAKMGRLPPAVQDILARQAA